MACLAHSRWFSTLLIPASRVSNFRQELENESLESFDAVDHRFSLGGSESLKVRSSMSSNRHSFTVRSTSDQPVRTMACTLKSLQNPATSGGRSSFSEPGALINSSFLKAAGTTAPRTSEVQNGAKVLSIRNCSQTSNSILGGGPAQAPRHHFGTLQHCQDMSSTNITASLMRVPPRAVKYGEKLTRSSREERHSRFSVTGVLKPGKICKVSVTVKLVGSRPADPGISTDVLLRSGAGYSEETTELVECLLDGLVSDERGCTAGRAPSEGLPGDGLAEYVVHVPCSIWSSLSHC
mmetsp:Transcript_9194/g.25706  ORF Transcript_9194/g.25706 Transcript_9194/m.25706 type:complete len:294 (-) Transcript_9194:222-1103(-)